MNQLSDDLKGTTSGLKITNESIIDEIKKIDSSFSIRSLLLDTLKKARDKQKLLKIAEKYHINILEVNGTINIEIEDLQTGFIDIISQGEYTCSYTEVRIGPNHKDKALFLDKLRRLKTDKISIE